MAEVRKVLLLPALANEVWAVVGDFNSLPDWLAPIETSTLERDGRIRRLTLREGGGEVVEQLEAHDDSQRQYAYRILESPLPVTDYVSTITVRENGQGFTEVEWRSTFEPVGVSADDASALISGIYDAGFDGMRKLFDG